MAAPVVAIGLDAAPLALIERWIAQGRLPMMARLFEEEAWDVPRRRRDAARG